MNPSSSRLIRPALTLGLSALAIASSSALAQSTTPADAGIPEAATDTPAVPATAGQEDSSTLEAITVVGRASPAPVEFDRSYQPTPDASTLRSTLPPLEVPQVVNIVPAQVLRDQRPRHMDDALNNVSGITQGNTLAGTQDTMMKRGFGGNRDGSIMHNGMPLVQGRGFNAAAESVEVLKGPSSMFYGIMDPGGVVNVVSKKPLRQQRNALSVSGMSYGQGRNGAGITLDTTGPLGDKGLAYRLVMDHGNEDYWRNFGKRRDTLIAPSLAWYGKDTQVVAWYEYRDYLVPFDRSVILNPTTGRPLDIPAERRLDEPFNEMDGQSHLAQLSLDHRLGRGWSGHISLSYNRETYDANQLRVNRVNTANGTLRRSSDATHGALSTDSYGTAYVDGSTEWGGFRHDIQFGMDAEYRKIHRRDLLRQPSQNAFSYLNPVYGVDTPSTVVVPSDSDQTDQLHNQSLFVQDAMHLNDQWILVGGVRYLQWSQLAGRGRPFTANTNTRDSAWLPRFGVVYQWKPELSVYLSYSQSLRPSSSIAPLDTGTVITSAMKPEEGKSWELGTKYETPGGLSASLAIFNLDKKNVLVSQLNESTGRNESRTTGAARARGVELDVAGQLSDAWSFIGSFAYLDAKTTKDPEYAGNRLWNTARITSAASLVHDFGRVGGLGQLRLGGTVRHVGKRPGDTANTFWLPGYTVADVFTTFETPVFGRDVRFQFNVKNLFDRVYYPSASNQYGIAIGDARQFSLQMAFEF